MIISRTPLRISLFGGGTDFSAFYKEGPGEVVSFAIDKSIYVAVNKRFDGRLHLRYSKTEIGDVPDDLKHDIVRECLKMVGVKGGVEIVITSDVPAVGTGLGSSSALTVGLLNVLINYIGGSPSREFLAKLACEIEINKVGSPIGKQDQYACFLKGEKVLTKGHYGDCPKKIENIRVGDCVLSYNEITKEKIFDKVVKTSDRLVDNYLEIKFSNNNVIKCTEEHPIYIVDGGWTSAKNLKRGDKVIQKKYPALGLRLYNLRDGAKEERSVVAKSQWNNKKQRKQMINALKKTYATDEYRVNRSVKLFCNLCGKEFVSIVKNTLHCKRCRDIGKKMSTNHLRNWMRANRIKPTIPEKKLNFCLQEWFPKEWKYVGNGKLIINGKCPDFVNINGKKKLIELYGDYWHRGQNPNDRIKYFKPFGWNTLVVWEGELKNKKKLKEKLEQFLYNPNVEIIRVDNIIKREGKCQVFNIETEKFHNYFIHGILVHNCALGGFNYLKFNRDDSVSNFSLYEGYEEIINWHIKHFALFYIPQPRESFEILKEYSDNIENNRIALNNHLGLVGKFILYLKSGMFIINELGGMLDTSWRIKKASSSASNELIEKAFEVAKGNGSLGGKMLGAGQGGFMLLVDGSQGELTEAMEDVGFSRTDFKLSEQGTHIIYKD